MFNKSLDNILGTFTKVQADLAAFVDRTKQEQDGHKDQAAFHEAKASAKAYDIDRAQSVMTRIETLVGN